MQANGVEMRAQQPGGKLESTGARPVRGSALTCPTSPSGVVVNAAMSRLFQPAGPAATASDFGRSLSCESAVVSRLIPSAPVAGLVASSTKSDAPGRARHEAGLGISAASESVRASVEIEQGVSCLRDRLETRTTRSEFLRAVLHPFSSLFVGLERAA